MTLLRQHMLEELNRHNYSPFTARAFILAVKQVVQYFGKSPDKLGAEEVRRYDQSSLETNFWKSQGRGC